MNNVSVICCDIIICAMEWKQLDVPEEIVNAIIKNPISLRLYHIYL